MNQPAHPLAVTNYAVRMLLGLISRLHRRGAGLDQPGTDPAALPVTALTRKTAITEIFRQSHADPPHAQMLLTELMAAWPQTGLRAADLAAGLNEMLEEDSLRLARHHPAAVALSESGRRWLDGADVDPRSHAEQLAILRAARQRQEDQPPEDAEPGHVPQWRVVDRRVSID